MTLVYLISIFISPQTWIDLFIGMRVDIFIYPLWFISLILTGKSNRLFEYRLSDKIFIGLLLWTIISVYLNEIHESSVKIIINYIKWFVLYMLFIATLDNFNSIKRTIKFLIFVVMILVIEGIQHKLSFDGIGWAGQKLDWVNPEVLKAGGTGRTKWISIFDGPGSFCIAYTMTLPFILQYLDKHNYFYVKIFALILVLPLFLAAWYTGSRGGLLAILGVVSLYTVTRYATKLSLSIGKIAGIAFIVFIGFMAAPNHLTQVKDQSHSAQHRVDMWVIGINMTQENPLFGIGRGNFGNYSGTLIAHNSTIENMAELGMPGLFIWVALIYFSFKNIYLFSISTEDPVKKSYAKALALSIIGYLISSMFVTLEYEIFYMLLAFASALGRLQDSKVYFKRKDFIMITGICLSFAVTLKIFVMGYY